MTIGILGLQGACEPHEARLRQLGVATRRVLTAADFPGLAALVIPGGESTTMLRLGGEDLWQALAGFGAQRPVWGVCAGCILLAREVEHPAQRCLGLMDLTVVRNAYGAQNESFVAELSLDLAPVDPAPVALTGIFIRAPRIRRVGPEAEILARHGEDPVLVREGRFLAATFHPELTDSDALHRYFLALVQG